MTKYKLPNPPKLRTRDALVAIVDDGPARVVDRQWLAGRFDITVHDAEMRLERLRRWGLMARWRKDPANRRSGFHYQVNNLGMLSYYKWSHKKIPNSK